MNRTPRTAQRVAAQPLAGLTVLVVDDHYDTVQMLLEYLLSVGAIVLGLRSARAAMGFAKTVRFDAVLINLRMPGEDGRWFLRELDTSKTLSARTPVFALSSERQDEPDRGDGFAGYFLKPVNLDVLVAALSGLPRHHPPERVRAASARR